MEDTTSEATSSYLSQQMAYPPWSFQQHTNGVIVNSQANQYQSVQGEPSEASDQPRARGHRAKLDEDQKKEHKRQSDVKYRLNQKIKLKELSAENKRLQEENRWLCAENGSLQAENGRLTVKNRQLEGYARGQQSKGKGPAENTERQDSYVSQSICQVDHQNIYAQDHRGVDSRNEAVAYMFDGLEMNDLRSLLLPENEKNQNGGGAIHDSAPEQSGCSLGDMSHADMAMTDFLTKLDEEVLSNADCSDFSGLEGERATVGRYSFPLSLVPTVRKINDAYGDVSATSLINPRVAGEIYVLFCATIKEMEVLQLEQVTEKIMFKWRDTIKDALRINFNVRFAMEHLKKIACAYFGQSGCLLLQTLDERITELEAEVNECKAKRAEIHEGSKSSVAAAREFNGVPVSTGLFPQPSCNRFMHV